MRELTIGEIDAVAGGLEQYSEYQNSDPGTGGSGGIGGGGSTQPPPFVPATRHYTGVYDPLAATMADLQAFFNELSGVGDQHGGGDQNSYYDDDPQNASPLSADFLEAFGWLPGINSMPDSHYFEYLTQEIDPEFLIEATNASQFSANFSNGHVTFTSEGSNNYSINLNGVALSAIWHPGQGTTTADGPDGPQIIVSGGHWTFHYDPTPISGGNQGGASGVGGASNHHVTQYPAGFDHGLDTRIDALAHEVEVEIKSKSDTATTEYGAILWMDTNGVLHRTGLVKGTSNKVEWPTYAALGIPSDAIIVGDVHSHPSMYAAGINPTTGQPLMLYQPSHVFLSAGDFDGLLDMINPNKDWRFNPALYRMYLVHANGTDEYYAFDQDQSKYGGSGQAPWANPSSDFHSSAVNP